MIHSRRWGKSQTDCLLFLSPPLTFVQFRSLSLLRDRQLGEQSKLSLACHDLMYSTGSGQTRQACVSPGLHTAGKVFDLAGIEIVARRDTPMRSKQEHTFPDVPTLGGGAAHLVRRCLHSMHAAVGSPGSFSRWSVNEHSNTWLHAVLYGQLSCLLSRGNTSKKIKKNISCAYWCCNFFFPRFKAFGTNYSLYLTHIHTVNTQCLILRE